MRGQDVAQIRAVQDVLESRQDTDPDGRPVVAGYVSVGSMLAYLCAP
jgi:hypothetical protein